MNRKFFFMLAILILIGVSVVFFNNLNPSKISPTGWEYDWEGKIWKANGDAPSCPDPLVFPSPVNVDLVSGILYPGQLRGGDYKPHGGFRFDNRDTNDIEVKAIMDGVLLKASKYEEMGDVQTFIFLVNDCGIMVMHDHILTPSPKLKEALRNIPVNKNGDSRTTLVEPKVYFKKGEVLATEIGYRNYPGGYNNKNIGLDFGLYDLRKTNGVIYDSVFRKNHPNIDEYGAYALCFINYLSESDREIIKSLPASGNEGKSSDYCN